jgi:RNA polymerase sigma-70 factor (ECF subfamily)
MIEGEEQLIERARHGDKSCFSALYDYYLPPIYRFIYMKVTHREEAEDLSHEVFLSAWQNLTRYEAQGFPFGSWLYQIARNKVIDYYRVKKPNVSLEHFDADLIKAEFTIEAKADTALTLEGVRGAMKQLTPDQQDVLLMKFMEDLSHRDIALIMGKSEGAVRLIQHRALQELKKTLRTGEIA